MFLRLDADIQRVVAEILAAHPRLVEAGGKRSAADPFVIAVARLHKCVVVTGESRSGNSTSLAFPKSAMRSASKSCLSSASFDVRDGRLPSGHSLSTISSPSRLSGMKRLLLLIPLLFA